MSRGGPMMRFLSSMAGSKQAFQPAYRVSEETHGVRFRVHPRGTMMDSVCHDTCSNRTCTSITPLEGLPFAASTRSQVRDWTCDRSMILINSCSLPACDLRLRSLPHRPRTTEDGDPRVALTAVLAVQGERERGEYGGGRTCVL
jgi:hypothetical protein